jgi:hypothetical protein
LKGRKPAVPKPDVPHAQREAWRRLKVVHVSDLLPAGPLDVGFLNVFIQFSGARVARKTKREANGGEFHKISSFHGGSFLKKEVKEGRISWRFLF